VAGRALNRSRRKVPRRYKQNWPDAKSCLPRLPSTSERLGRSHVDGLEVLVNAQHHGQRPEDRPALAGKLLKDMGYERVYNLGAFKDWAESGAPIDKAS